MLAQDDGLSFHARLKIPSFSAPGSEDFLYSTCRLNFKQHSGLLAVPRTKFPNTNCILLSYKLLSVIPPSLLLYCFTNLTMRTIYISKCSLRSMKAVRYIHAITQVGLGAA